MIALRGDADAEWVELLVHQRPSVRLEGQLLRLALHGCSLTELPRRGFCRRIRLERQHVADVLAVLVLVGLTTRLEVRAAELQHAARSVARRDATQPALTA